MAYEQFIRTPQAPFSEMLYDPPRSDTADNGYVIRALWVGIGGDVSVVDVAGNVMNFPGLPAGTWLEPFEVKRINATGTTAKHLVAYW